MKKLYGLPSAFGKALAQERSRRGLTQEQLAERIDSGNVYISLLESGRRQPSLNTLLLLAEALEISPARLIERTSSFLENQPH